MVYVYNFDEYCENEKINWTGVAIGASLVFYIATHFGIPKKAAEFYINKQIEASNVINVDTVSELNRAKESVIDKVNRDEIILNKKEVIDSLNNIIFLSNNKFVKKTDMSTTGSYYHSNKDNIDYIFLINDDYNTIYHELMHYVVTRSTKSTDIGYDSITDIQESAYIHRLFLFFDFIKGDTLNINDSNKKWLNIVKAGDDLIGQKVKKNKYREYYLENQEVYVRLNQLADFLRSRKIIGDRITEENVKYMYSGKLFRSLSDADKDYLYNNPDIVILIPLITEADIDTINKII